MISAAARPLEPALGDRLCGRPLLLLLDVDGTLSPIAPRPEYATIPESTQQMRIRCNDCGAEHSYKSSEILRNEIPVPENFTPHPLFQ